MKMKQLIFVVMMSVALNSASGGWLKIVEKLDHAAIKANPVHCMSEDSARNSCDFS
jgi:hypothetical protein